MLKIAALESRKPSERGAEEEQVRKCRLLSRFHFACYFIQRMVFKSYLVPIDHTIILYYTYHMNMLGLLIKKNVFRSLFRNIELLYFLPNLPPYFICAQLSPNQYLCTFLAVREASIHEHPNRPSPANGGPEGSLRVPCCAHWWLHHEIRVVLQRSQPQDG